MQFSMLFVLSTSVQPKRESDSTMQRLRQSCRDTTATAKDVTPQAATLAEYPTRFPASVNVTPMMAGFSLFGVIYVELGMDD